MSASTRIQLARGGRPLFRIATARSASATDEFAAEELRRHLQAVCGAGSRLRNEGRARGPQCDCIISINDSAVAEAAGIHRSGLNLGPEAFHWQSHQGNLYLLAGGPRGTLYGVYDLLETVGCRWFTPEISRIPLVPDLSVPAATRTAAPAFEFRDVFSWDAGDPLWWVRNRLNGWYTPVPGCWGGFMDYGLFVHTFDRLVPPGEFFATHPEYFSFTGGQRRKEVSQLCLTNADVLRIVTDRVLDCMRQNPQARLFSVSQNDCAGYCECPECAKVAEAEGSQSGVLLRFVNAVAAETATHFPDNFIDTLAYQYTLDAPRLARPHRNVRVRLCSICCCQGHAYGTCDHPESLRFLRALEAWSRITSQIYIWHYCTDFAHYPLPMADFDEINANLQLYRRTGVYGVFMQGMGEEGGGGESMMLRSYILSKLLWNPDQPVWPLVREFLTGVCGAAAAGVEAYMQVFHERVRNDRNLHPSLYDQPTHPLFDAPTLNRAEAALSDARRQAKGSAKLYVDQLQAGLDYARLWQAGGRFALSGSSYRGQSTPDQRHAFKGMLKTWEKAGIQRIQEGCAFTNSLLKFKQRLLPHKVFWLKDATQQIAVVPDLGGRLLEWHACGRQWLAPADPDNRWLFYPCNGGYSELVSYGMYHNIGWLEPYTCELRRNGELALRAELDGQVEATRCYALRDGTLHITSVLTNHGKAARRLQWGSGLHLQLPAGPEAAACHVAFTAMDGTASRLVWNELPGGLGAAKVFEAEKRPAGKWTLTLAGTTLEHTFDGGLVHKVIIGREGATRLCGLDLRTDYIELAPQASLTLRQTLRSQ